MEMLVTIALLALLISLAIPTMGETLRSWRRDSATRSIMTSLQLARTESIKSSRQVVVCPSSNGTACVAANEWRNGWLVFVDDGAGTPSNANNQVLNLNERILQVVTAPGGIASMTTSGGVQLMQFLPNGLMVTTATTLTVTPTGATTSTKVDKIGVSRVGRVNVVTELP